MRKGLFGKNGAHKKDAHNNGAQEPRAKKAFIKKSFVKKLALATLGIIVVFILLPASLITLLIATESGANWLLSTLEKRELLSYQNLRGSITEGLQVERLTVETAAIHIHIEQLAVNTELMPLLYGELRLARLSANTITIELPSTPEQEASEEPFTPPGFLTSKTPLLPFQVTVEQLSIKQLTIVQAETEHSLQNIELSGHADQVGIDPLKLRLDYGRHHIELTGLLHLWPRLRTRVNIDWTAQLPDNKTVSGSAEIKGNKDRLTLSQQTHGDIVSELQLTLTDWLEQPQFDASGNLEQLRLPGETALVFSGITFQLSGSPSTVSGKLDGKLDAAGQPPAEFSLQASTDRQQLDITHLQLNTPVGNATITGQYLWGGDSQQWQGEITTENFAANYFHPLLPERLNGSATISGSFDQHLQLRFTTDNLHGELHGKPLQIGLAGTLDDRTLTLQQLNLVSGETQIQAAGTVGPERLDANFDLRIPNLSRILPDASGSLSAAGALGGTPQQPTLNGRANGENLTIAGLSVATMEAQANLAKGSFAADRIALTGLQYQSLSFNSLTLTLKGPWKDPELTAVATNDSAQIDLAGKLTLDDAGTKAITFKQLSINSQQAGRWQLQQPATAQLQASGDWSLERFCLEENRGLLCLSGNGNGQQLQTSLQANGLSLSLLDAFVTLPVQLSGRVDIDAELQRSADHLQGRATIGQNGDAIVIDLGEDRQLSLTELNTSIDVRDRQLNTKLDAVLNGDGKLRGQGRIDNLLNPSSLVSANLDYSLPDLSPYTALDPAIEISGGSLHGTLNISNTLREPHLETRSNLSVPSIYIQPLAVEWRNLNAEITSQPGETTYISATLEAGSGTLQVNGEIQGLPPTDWSASLLVTGNNALLTGQSERRVIASPNLTIDAVPGKLKIGGEITIPEAHLSLLPSPNKLSLTEDAVIHSEATRTNGWTTAIDVKIILKEKVHFSAHGLKTNVAGTLQVTRKARGSLLGQGELNLLEGSYRAYGQDLTINRGVLQFSGSLKQPRVDITAVRKIADVTAGLHVTGPVDVLQTRLFSEPTLSDSEILSYIIRGKPLSDTSVADQNFLSNAALSYAISQSTPITEKLAELTGFDEVGFEAEEGVQSLGFTLGKYLTPELYVRYGIGVVDKISKLFAQYQLTQRLYLQTEVGAGHSIDLLYRSQ